MWKFVKSLFGGKKQEVAVSEEAVGIREVVGDVIYHYPKPATKTRPPRIVIPEPKTVSRADIIAWMNSVKEWEYIRPRMVG